MGGTDRRSRSNSLGAGKEAKEKCREGALGAEGLVQREGSQASLLLEKESGKSQRCPVRSQASSQGEGRGGEKVKKEGLREYWGRGHFRAGEGDAP